jgi:hypothetical protein
MICVCFGLILAPTPVAAFSLLGPYEDWMQQSNGFRLPIDLGEPYVDDLKIPGDIGGPMCLSNGYRWNVPVVTYGFDSSFIDFFGSNGVAQVEAAIEILNGLPLASSIVTTNYQTFTQEMNLQASSESLNDLKSAALGLLIEHLGLASPTRSADVLRSWYPGPIPEEPDVVIVQRNFDPVTLEASQWIDDIQYDDVIASIVPVLDSSWVQLLPAQYPAVADNILPPGFLYTGLTQDDVGGLSYLLSTNNVNYETLLPGVSGVGNNSNSFVNGAWRPGVDKITFVPHPYDAVLAQFLPMTNQFMDTYITNGIVTEQQLQRMVSQPDFLFCAGDTYANFHDVLPFSRTGTSNWLNNASLNGNPSGAGPGVIQPPVEITFAKLGRQLWQGVPYGEDSVMDYSTFWGTYDGSTNASIVYPVARTGTNYLTIRLQLLYGSFLTPPADNLVWTVASQAGAELLLQTSTDLTNWITLATIDNDGSICTLTDYKPASAQRFYRVAPQ